MLAQEAAGPAFRNRAHEFVHYRSALEQFHVGNTSDGEMLRDLGILLGVDFRQKEISRELISQAFQNGTENPAGTAPRGPEINGHGTLERFIYDRLLKVGELHISHVKGCRHSKLPLFH
jgi:hypothetical protein